jgi:hypothetical protein
MADAGRKVETIPMVDFAAFMDSKWNDMVIFVCKMLEVYSVSELWAMDIVRFTGLVHKAEQILKEKKKAAMG